MPQNIWRVAPIPSGHVRVALVSAALNGLWVKKFAGSCHLRNCRKGSVCVLLEGLMPAQEWSDIVDGFNQEILA